MNSIIEDLGDREAETFEPSEIDRWLSGHSHWSPATANRYKTVLSKAYQLALKNGGYRQIPPALSITDQRRTNGYATSFQKRKIGSERSCHLLRQRRLRLCKSP
jgi:hypothetical protein